ncbi:MAG TPA: hypothetical protein PL041_13820, partial [Melioribacteraceae bacterium]|nr:hypothetical protein [Melioribacteraceae bacterium]
MNSSINIILSKIKNKLTEAFNNYSNNFKLNVTLNNYYNTITANVNGCLFITYKEEKLSDNLTNNTKLF